MTRRIDDPKIGLALGYDTLLDGHHDVESGIMAKGIQRSESVLARKHNWQS